LEEEPTYLKDVTNLSDMGIRLNLLRERGAKVSGIAKGNEN